MSWPIVLVLGVCVFTAHSAVDRRKVSDATLSRIVRSPHYGSSYHHDDFDVPLPAHGPPPPSIVYHTQNWSGVSKGVGGTPQGVFSGAAASAQGGAPTDSEAFSIAASGTVPVPTDNEGQVKESLVKSGYGTHSNNVGFQSHHSVGALGNKHGGSSNSYGSSGEGQFNIKSSGLELNGGVTGSGSDELENQSGAYSGGATGFDRKLAEDISANNDRQSEQRSFSGQSFGSGRPAYGRQNGQDGSFKGFDAKESESNFGSGFSTGINSAGNAAADFHSQLQKSNKGELAGLNAQSGQNADASLGFGSKSSVTSPAGSTNQFGQYGGHSSGSGYQSGASNTGFKSNGGSYGASREFSRHSDNSRPHFDHQDDIHRHGKSHFDSHNFDQSGDGKYGDQRHANQGFSAEGQVRSNGFSNSQSSSDESNRGNYGSGHSGSEVGYSGNHRQEEFGKFGEGLHASQGGAHDFIGTQHAKQLGQLDSGLVVGQAETQSHSNTGFGYNKESGSSDIGNKGAIDTKGNGGVPSAEGSLPGNVGASGQEDIQSTLGSALNLASQGLQASQRAPCRTCDKGSYALSNAKSHSGSAIALSIGG